MKTIFRPATSALMFGLVFLAMGSGQALAADDEATKLKDLERAMSAPENSIFRLTLMFVLVHSMMHAI